MELQSLDLALRIKTLSIPPSTGFCGGQWVWGAASPSHGHLEPPGSTPGQGHPYPQQPPSVVQGWPFPGLHGKLDPGKGWWAGLPICSWFCASIRAHFPPAHWASLVSASRSAWFAATTTQQLWAVSRELLPLHSGHPFPSPPFLPSSFPTVFAPQAHSDSAALPSSKRRP